MTARDFNLAYWHSDEGVEPDDASLQAPWTLTDTASAPPTYTLAKGVVLNCASGDQHYSRPLVPSEATSGVKRGRDSFYLQFQVQVLTEASGRLVVHMDDRERYAAVRLDKQTGALEWVDSSGTTIKTISLTWPYLADAVIYLFKRARSVFELWVNGQLISQLAYARGEASTALTSTAGVGWFGCTTASAARVDALELSINTTLPHDFRYQRVVLNLPALVQQRLNARHRAVIRSMLGLFEAGLDGMTSYQDQRNALRLPLEDALEAHGEVLPSDEDDRFTESGTVSIVREWVRLDGTTARIEATPDVDFIDQGGMACSFTVRVRRPSPTPDNAGRLLIVRMDTEDKRPGATLYEAGGLGTDQWAWVIDDDGIDPSGAVPVVPLGETWPVNPFSEHRVSLVCLRPDTLLLIVDGAIVDRVAYSALSKSSSTTRIRIQTPATVANGLVELRDIKIETWRADLATRTLLLRWLGQHNVPSGGCERSDEMELVQNNRAGVMGLRGTEAGILAELKRMACENDEVDVVQETDQLGWFLNVSFPTVTPVFLNVQGSLARIYVEFPITGLESFTYQQLADWVATHLVPLSTLELQYEVGLVSYMTGSSSVVGSDTRLTVKDTTGFEVGDGVTVRNAANTTYENVTVTQVVSSTQLDVEQTVATWVSGDVVRKTLATS